MSARKSGTFLASTGQAAPGVLSFTKLIDTALVGDNNTFTSAAFAAYQIYYFEFYADVDVADEVYMTFNAVAAGYYNTAQGTDAKSRNNAASFHVGTSNTPRMNFFNGFIRTDASTAMLTWQWTRGSDGAHWAGGGSVAVGAQPSTITLVNGAGANKWKSGARMVVYGVRQS